MASTTIVTDPLRNAGRYRNAITGIQGQASPGIVNVKLDVNKRYHKLNFQYTEGAGVAASVVVGLTAMTLKVNGVVIRDTTPQEEINIFNATAGANGLRPYTLATGEFNIFFSEPSRWFLHNNDLNAWDLAGQNTFELNMTIAGGRATPNLIGSYEFDYNRNMRTPPSNQQNAVPVPFLQPVARHLFTFQLGAGVNWINTLPINYPIMRMWLRGNPVTSIISFEVYADGSKWAEESGLIATPFIQQNIQNLGHYGIIVGNASGNAGYDCAFVADIDSKPWKALKVGNSLQLKVTTNAIITLSVVMETLPGGFQA
jgi:hypothetical protein